MSWEGYQISEEDFSRIGRILFAKAKASGLPIEDIPDLIQETFLHAQAALNKDRFTGLSTLDTWVVGIGKRQLLKLFRARRAAKRSGAELSLDAKPEREEAARGLEVAEPSPDTIVADRQTLRRVVEDIAALSDELRRPLVLTALGMTYKEIASILEIRLDLVTSRVHQAREILRRKHDRSN